MEEKYYKKSMTFRAKLITSFVVVIAICGMVATYVGVILIGDGIIRQAQDKVRVDLNSAREIYNERLNRIEDTIRMTAIRFVMQEGLARGTTEIMKNELREIRDREMLDILTVTDARGRVLYRTRNPDVFGDDQSFCQLIHYALKEKRLIASTEIIPREELLKEGQALAARAYIPVIPTPKAKPRSDTEETSGMMMKAAAPVLDSKGNLLGLIYGGVLLNRHLEIVDKIKQTIYQNEIYEGEELGTATIFQGDLRISTNVTRDDGSRAIGTRVSEEVYDQVLAKGLPWIERAFVVNSWYITAYEPIKNITGDIIGMLYVGMLEAKFSDMRQATMWVFLGLTLGGMAVALIVSYFLARKLLQPIRYLVYASERLAQGDLKFRVHIKTQDLIGKLGEAFNSMAESLLMRDENLKEQAQQTIEQSERLATVGQLAAGVAHELNNPMGSVLIYSHLCLETLEDDDPKRENLEKIVTQATRCKKIVQGLLDFSRQTEPNVDLANINDLLNAALTLLENQALFQNIEIQRELADSPPPIMVDGAQIQQVFINITLNAAEAMEGQGALTIRTKVSDNQDSVEVEFADTGCGIPDENMDRLFEPFYTTKEVGKGTGLGLAISYGIIKKNKGSIDVESEVGRGTTFTIRFPVSGKDT